MVEVESYSKEKLPIHRELLIVGHTYQPHREILLPASGGRTKVSPETNDQVYEECYRPIFVESESIPSGLVFSLLPGFVWSLSINAIWHLIIL